MRNSEFVDEAHIPDADFSIILSAEKMLKRLAAGLFLNSGWWICRSTEQFPPGHVHVFSCFRFRWICRFILMMSIRCYLHEICNYILLYYVNCVHMKIIIYIYINQLRIYMHMFRVSVRHTYSKTSGKGSLGSLCVLVLWTPRRLGTRNIFVTQVVVGDDTMVWVFMDFQIFCLYIVICIMFLFLFICDLNFCC